VAELNIPHIPDTFGRAAFWDMRAAVQQRKAPLVLGRAAHWFMAIDLFYKLGSECKSQ